MALDPSFSFGFNADGTPEMLVDDFPDGLPDESVRGSFASSRNARLPSRTQNFEQPHRVSVSTNQTRQTRRTLVVPNLKKLASKVMQKQSKRDTPMSSFSSTKVTTSETSRSKKKKKDKEPKTPRTAKLAPELTRNNSFSIISLFSNTRNTRTQKNPTKSKPVRNPNKATNISRPNLNLGSHHNLGLFMEADYRRSEDFEFVNNDFEGFATGEIKEESIMSHRDSQSETEEKFTTAATATEILSEEFSVDELVLVRFYQKVRPCQSDEEIKKRCRKLLKRYSIGTLALELNAKYGSHPTEWERQLVKSNENELEFLGPSTNSEAESEAHSEYDL